MNNESLATNAVIEFVTGTTLDRIPGEALSLARQAVTDGLGVILAGSTTRGSSILRDYVRNTGGVPEATILGAEVFRSGPAAAALVNAAAGHAMDYDDTQLSSTPDRIFGLLTHPTVPPLSAALALGERLGASGSRVLEAYLVGVEVECKLVEAIDPSHYRNGFHTSSTLGTFGAATAAAKLLGLDAEALANALAIASSTCSGIRVNFGTMTKPLHVGRAAQNGVIAAELAARGFTGGAHALDGPWGFFRVFGFGRDFEPSRLIGALGNPYTIVSPGVSIKPYPCGCLGHPSMDAMLKLVVDHDIKPEQVKAIRLRAGSNILNPLRYSIATTELEAKFCPAFMLSSIVLRRRAGIREFTDAFVGSAPVQDMMRKVTTVLDPAIEARGVDKMRSRVEVDLVDGRTLAREADERYRGGPEDPFTREDLRAKFTECAELVLDREAIEQAFELIGSVDQLPDIRVLVNVLTGGVTGVPSAVPAVRCQ
ncbi:MAG: MmgE/PrpD family protein [Acidobacteria bacterium]|nr:MmgE/PrpD family protein [Acidobacteriota bacterium]